MKKITPEENDTVYTTEDFWIGDVYVYKGTKGTIVDVYENGRAYEVEFDGGNTVTLGRRMISVLDVVGT